MKNLGGNSAETNDYEGWYVDDVKIVREKSKPEFVALGTVSYIHANGQLVARIDQKPAMPEKVYYYHNDYLGSPRVITDSSGEVVWSKDYLSYGEMVDTGEKDIIENHFTFTGKEYDEATGLYYFGARYYDPKVGRFITKDPILEPLVFQTLPIPLEEILEDTLESSSPDFIVPEMIDIPQNFHPYMYCYNDPINWIDPFGLCGEKPWYEQMWEDYWQWQYEFWSDPNAVAMAMFMPGVVKVGKYGKTAEELISGFLKRSRSYHSNYADKTYEEILRLAKKGDKKAQQMKKLIERGEKIKPKIKVKGGRR